MSTLQADLSILWPALIAGILVVLSHVPLGQQVLARGIVFIDLAIAQVAGLGVIAAHVSGLGAGGWITQVAAAAAALVGALLLTWTERKRPEAQEALIGVYLVFTSLIVPAVATYRYPPRRQLLLGYLLALASYLVGLALSAVVDLPSSAVIVWAMALIAVLVHLGGREEPGNARH